MLQTKSSKEKLNIGSLERTAGHFPKDTHRHSPACWPRYANRETAGKTTTTPTPHPRPHISNRREGHGIIRHKATLLFEPLWKIQKTSPVTAEVRRKQWQVEAWLSHGCSIPRESHNSEDDKTKSHRVRWYHRAVSSKPWVKLQGF